tara:strand:+ start:202 stop:561 length:360 start_codon:yes stop_codon:yes gene_type:complete
MSQSRPENIPGYEAPSQTNSKPIGRGTKYYCFNPDKRIKSIEDCTTVEIGNGNYTTNIVDAQVCPTCGEQPVFECNCIFADKRCGAGHVWYTDREGIVKDTDPHHKKEETNTVPIRASK